MKKDFYSSIEWLFWSNFELKNLPSEIDELVDFMSMIPTSAVEDLEEEYERNIRWKRRLKRLRMFFMSLITKDEFSGRYKK